MSPTARAEPSKLHGRKKMRILEIYFESSDLLLVSGCVSSTGKAQHGSPSPLNHDKHALLRACLGLVIASILRADVRAGIVIEYPLPTIGSDTRHNLIDLSNLLSKHSILTIQLLNSAFEVPDIALKAPNKRLNFPLLCLYRFE